MSLLECIENGRKEGKLTDDQAKKAVDLFIEFETVNKTKMSPDQAQAQAGKDTFDALEFEAKQRKRRMVLQRARQQNLMKDIDSFKGDDDGEALVSLLERDGSGRAPYSNVAARQDSIRGVAHALMDSVLANLRKTEVLGRTTRKTKAKQENMVREVFGENTGDQAARAMAQAWKEASEFLRLSFNRSGGAIPKRSDWGMPQVHNNDAVRKAGKDVWKDSIRPLLDLEKMISFKTGKTMNEVEIEAALDEVWETIATEGFAKISPSSVGGQGKSLARRRTDSRFLVFKDADSWMKYQEDFGGGDAFNIMMSHVDTMSRDVALLEILGANPNSTIRFLKTQIQKRAKVKDAANGNSKASDKLKSRFYKFDNMFDYISGASHDPVSGFWARSFSGLGNLLTAAYLGSTSILAMAVDPNSTRIAKRMAGMDVFKSSLKQSFAMMTANNTTKQQAIRMGLIAENWSSVAYGQARYANEGATDGITDVISNVAMNLSLLSPFTQAGRWAFGMEFTGFIADNAKKAFDDLSPEFRDTLDRYGVNADDWAKLSDVEPYEFKGATFLRPDDIMAVDRDVAFKVLEMIQGMTNLAVPVASVRARTSLTGATRPGTLPGELLRSFAMFKNFPVTFFNNNIKAAFTQRTNARKMSIAGDLLISSSAMAALSIQLREMTKGRDPLPMDTKEFWGKAILQGGGLGIYGDFLFSNVNRFGGGLGETVAGARTGFVNDLRELTIGNVAQAIQGDDTKILSELVDFGGRYAPGASTWYLRLAIDRVVLDQLRLMTDPDAHRRFRRMERRLNRDYDQEYWWRPGSNQPDRSPDISNVMGD